MIHYYLDFGKASMPIYLDDDLNPVCLYPGGTGYIKWILSSQHFGTLFLFPLPLPPSAYTELKVLSLS
jgi:hypothetical protein